MSLARPAPAAEFGAVLLAGGVSRRMGRDKALLPLPGGRLLWQRQLAVLEALGAAELLISGPAKDGYPAAIRRLEDATPGLGPLSGLAAALGAIKAPLLVVLAIDLPMMSTGFLRGLLDRCDLRQGCVPRHPATGLFEPLAAVYPRECVESAERQLRSEDRSMQAFVRASGPMIKPYAISADEEPLFANWNDPAAFSPPTLD